MRIVTVAVLFLLCLLPFTTKPLHIDDPMYVWAAEHIVSHPFDFYGFQVNWHGTATPMAAVMKNPPLVSYYLALVGPPTGWSEAALHLALFLPALGVVAGTYVLARPLTRRPGEAALVACLAPVVVVSSTTVMSDVLMLCGWIWSLVFWMRGVRDRAPAFLAAAALGAGATALTKYFGVALLPLLALYGILRERRVWRWAPWLLLPIAILAAYQLGTERLYGRGLLLDASAYASAIRERTQWESVPKLLVGLAFTGACLASTIGYAPALWPRRALLGWGAATLGLVAVLASTGHVGSHALRAADGTHWMELLQFCLSAAAGLGIVSLVVGDVARDRSPEAVVLAAWAAGTFVFAVALNWSINGRALLPMAPVVGILVGRRLDRRAAATARTRWALVPAAALALTVARADEQLASTSRHAAELLSARIEHGSSTVWFEGHWGFQYYAEHLGFVALDFRHPHVHVGDVIVKPEGITNPIALPDGSVAPLSDVALESPALLSTMSLPLGAGFYSDVWGPLPFVFGRAPPERYHVFRALVPLVEP